MSSLKKNFLVKSPAEEKLLRRNASFSFILKNIRHQTWFQFGKGNGAVSVNDVFNWSFFLHIYLNVLNIPFNFIFISIRWSNPICIGKMKLNKDSRIYCDPPDTTEEWRKGRTGFDLFMLWLKIASLRIYCTIKIFIMVALSIS